MIRKLLKPALWFLLLALSIAGCAAEKQPEVIRNEGWITDKASLLPEPEKVRLAASLAAYERETCHQVFVLIVNSLSGESIGDFSQRVAKNWEIGQKRLGNGILVSIALEEGSVRIEVDSAFEWMINDGTADRILKELMFPYFQKDDFVSGIEQGLAEIMQVARLKIIPEDHRPEICRN